MTSGDLSRYWHKALGGTTDTRDEARTLSESFFVFRRPPFAPPPKLDTGASGTDELYFYSSLLPAEVLGFSSSPLLLLQLGRKRMSAPPTLLRTLLVLP